MIVPEDKTGVITRYREGPAELEKLLKNLTDADLDAVPARGGWTIRQIVHHIADGDDLWKLGIKMAMGDAQPDFSLRWYQELPQPTWAERWAYSRRPVDASLSLLNAVRTHLIQLVESVPDAWVRAIVVRKQDGELEQVPVGFILQMQGDHLFHHLKRINEILQEQSGV